jgi:hypothetical protein
MRIYIMIVSFLLPGCAIFGLESQLKQKIGTPISSAGYTLMYSQMKGGDMETRSYYRDRKYRCSYQLIADSKGIIREYKILTPAACQ